MDNHDPKIQINKSEVIHDLNNLNYLLRTLAKVIDMTHGLPPEVKMLATGAITSTDNLIAKLGGSSKASEKSSGDKSGRQNG